MIFSIDKYFANQTIKIPVKTMSPEKLVIKAYHSKKPYTFYFDTAPTISGTDAFIIKIPNCPKETHIELYNNKNGNINYDSSFKIGKITISELPINSDIIKKLGKNVQNFIKFSDEFAENAGILSAQNSVYVSPNGEFRIDYKDVITTKNGTEMRTPARINTRTRIIEISKKYYLYYTVPGRKAINLHEFAHLWKNNDMHDEVEADKHAIFIYLLTGNPVIEAYNVFLRVFYNAPTRGNINRYKKLDEFIRNSNATLNRNNQFSNIIN